MTLNTCDPKISIGVPVYKAEKFIERCVISLFEQTYPNIEYVFVDDCTPDRSIEILESIILRYPLREPIVKLIRNTSNLGSATSRNIILDNCTGDFLLWVDSDDYLEFDTIDRLVSIQKHYNCDILGFGVMKHSEKQGAFPYLPYLFFTPKDMFQAIIERKTHQALWCRLIRRLLFMENNIRFEDGQNVGEDFKVIILLSYYAKKVSSVKEIFYHYNCCNPTSLMNTFSVEKAMMTWHNIDIVKNFFRGKGSFYEDAIKKKEAKTIVSHLISCCSVSGNYMDFFKYLKSRTHDLKMKDLQGVEFAKKLIYVIPSYPLLKMSCRSMKRTKNLYESSNKLLSYFHVLLWGVLGC